MEGAADTARKKRRRGRVWAAGALGAFVLGLAAWGSLQRGTGTVSTPSRRGSTAAESYRAVPETGAGVTAGSRKQAGPATVPLSPEGEAALRGGVASLQQGRLPEAERAFRRAVRSDPRSALARDYLGLALLQQRQLDAALRQFREGVHLAPQSAVAWARIADVYQAKQDLKHAIQALEQAVKLEPEVAQLYFNLGVLYPRNLQLARGVASLRRCVELDPRNHSARFVLAGLLLQTAQLDEAEAELARAIALEPNSGAYHLALGRLLLKRQATPETSARAMGALDRALALGVEDTGELQLYRGLCLQRLGKWKASLEPLLSAVQFSPESARAQHALATTYLRLRRAPEARVALARFRNLRRQESARVQRSFYEEEVTRNREDPDAHYQLGVYLEEQGELLSAVSSLRRAAELSASQGGDARRRLRIHRRLEALYRRQGLTREAEAERAQARRLERAHG